MRVENGIRMYDPGEKPQLPAVVPADTCPKFHICMLHVDEDSGHMWCACQVPGDGT